jgi:hypothetical protein
MTGKSGDRIAARECIQPKEKEGQKRRIEQQLQKKQTTPQAIQKASHPPN